MGRMETSDFEFIEWIWNDKERQSGAHAVADRDTGLNMDGEGSSDFGRQGRIAGAETGCGRRGYWQGDHRTMPECR
jgi:hypothetical protein